MKKTAGAILLVLSLLFPLNVLGAMSSTNYYIYADAIDSGGNLSTAGIYSLQDTFGESPVGFTTSTWYEIREGYQAMERGYLIMTIDNTSVNLGSLSQSVVNSASTTVTISTDSSTGYALSIQSVSGTGLTAVSDGTVSAGSEEYGLSADGDDSLISGDVAVSAGTSLASSAVAIENSPTILTFKASMNAATVVNIYSQTVTLSASANF